MGGITCSTGDGDAIILFDGVCSGRLIALPFNWNYTASNCTCRGGLFFCVDYAAWSKEICDWILKQY